MKKPSFLPVLIGTGFGSGFSPFAPGTAGALLAALIWFGLSLVVSEICLIWLTVALILLFTVAGVWAVNRLEPYLGRGPVAGGGGRNGRSMDFFACCTCRKCLVCTGGFYAFPVCWTFLNHWVFAGWKVFREE